jgi:hypothetical protein
MLSFGVGTIQQPMAALGDVDEADLQSGFPCPTARASSNA